MFAAYDAFFDVGGDDEFQIGQVISNSYTSNVELFKGFYSGGVLPQHISVMGADPINALETGDLLSLLSNVPIDSGIYFEDTSAIIPFQEGAQGSTFDADAASTLSMVNFFLNVLGIDADQDGDAIGQFDVVPLWDGTTEFPVTESMDETLAAQAFIGAYTLGPAKIGTMDLPGLIRTSVKPNLTRVLKRYKGQTYFTQLRVSRIEPTITFTFEDKAKLGTIKALFASMNGCTQYFRKRVDGSTLVAEGTAQHIAITLGGGITVTDSINASGNDNGTFSLTAHGKTIACAPTSTIVNGS